MHTTSTSLLQRLKLSGQDPAWTRFVQLYAPLLFFWSKRMSLQDSDAADLVQDVLTHLLSKISDYSRVPQRSFRSWLRTVLINKWRDRLRRAAAEGADAHGSLSDQPVADPIEELTEAEYRQFLVRRALHLMQTDFEPTTWQACWEVVVQGRSGDDVARELGMTAGAVYVAKLRVLARLRQELSEFLD